MKIKKNLELSTSDFWYDLFDGGYINASEICVHEIDILGIQQAIKILKDFRQSCEESIEDFIQ